MVHQALLRNSTVFILLMMVFSCEQPSNQSSNMKIENSKLILGKTDTAINNKNGIIYLLDKPYSGILFTLFPNTIDTATIEAYENGLENGTWKKYYASNKLREDRQYLNGKKIDTLSNYWENGKKQLQYIFVNDEYQGLCKEWNEAGLLTKEMNYEKGYESGTQKWWYDNGKIKANYIIINGRRFGLLGTKNCINVSDSIFK